MIIFSFYNDVEEPNGMILKAYMTFVSTCGKENKLYASFLLLAVEKLSELGFQYFIEKFELSIMLYVSILDASMMHWTDAVSPFHYSYLN